jgi:hypothetical protein
MTGETQSLRRELMTHHPVADFVQCVGEARTVFDRQIEGAGKFFE